MEPNLCGSLESFACLHSSLNTKEYKIMPAKNPIEEFNTPEHRKNVVRWIKSQFPEFIGDIETMIFIYEAWNKPLNDPAINEILEEMKKIKSSIEGLKKKVNKLK